MLRPEMQAYREDPPVENARKSIFVLDPQPVVRFGLRALFDSQPDLQVVGESGSCREFVEHEAGIDVVMVDPELHDACGAEVLKRIHAARPRVSVLVFTANSDELRVVEAVQAGVEGYLTKVAKPADILRAVRVVGNRGCFLDPQVTSLVMGQVGPKERRQRIRHALTARERSVLGLLVQGKRNKEISDELYICERTVRFHLTAIFQKLQAANRTEAVRKAISQGLVNT